MGLVIREFVKWNTVYKYRPRLPKKWQRAAFIGLYVLCGVAVLACFVGLACLFGMGDVI